MNTEPALQSIDFNRFPTFLVIGANKAGTSSIHEYCRQHPQMVMSTIKEPMFFTSSTDCGTVYGERDSLAHSTTIAALPEYQSLFIPRLGAVACGECSTSYLANPDMAIPRIQALKPDMKIVACLREPTERAYSCYLMYYGSGLELRSFERALLDEIEGRVDALPQGQHYLALGLYYDAIQKYQTAFQKVYVALYDELRDRPGAFIRSLFHFLNVDEDFVPRLNERLNTAEQWLRDKERPHLTQRAREICVGFFREDKRLLQSVIDIAAAGWI